MKEQCLSTMQIRQEQLQAFDDAAMPAFENFMVDHLKRFATRHCAVLGEPGVRQVIQLGVKNAAAYGLTTRGPVRLFIELMFLLGSGFDRDPQLRWAHNILTDDNISDGPTRADVLYEASLDYYGRVIGLHSRFATAALRGIFDEAPTVIAISGSNFAHEVYSAMQRLYPEKCADAGEHTIHALIADAKTLAESMSATTQRTTILFAVCMFAFGYYFHADPLYPWISGTLQNTNGIKDPDQRVERLYEKTMTYIEHMLDYLEQA